MNETSTPCSDRPNKDKEKAWTPEDFKSFVEAIRPLAEEILEYKKNESESRGRRLSLASTHNRRLTYALMFFLAAVVSAMGILTWFGKVSGDALLFLAGTMTGYIITMVQGLTYPLFEEEPSPES